MKSSGCRKTRRQSSLPTQPGSSFDKQDSAKLKNQKSLNAGGEFLAKNQFGFAVVAVSAGMEGDTQKDLVANRSPGYGYPRVLGGRTSDSMIASLRLWEWAKQTETNSDVGWGAVQIFIYPAGTAIPPGKQPQAGIASKTALEPTSSGFGGPIRRNHNNDRR